MQKINGGVAVDDRGSVRFVNDFHFDGVKRFYQIQNHEVGFVRAWHGHKNEAKYVYVPKGSFLVGAVEFDRHAADPEKFILSSESPAVLYIPQGYANGFMNLTPDAIIQFFSTSTLDESLGDDIRFNADRWNIWDIERR